MVLNNESLRRYRAGLDIILNEYGKKHGLQISIGNIRYDKNSFSTKLSAVVAENALQVEQINWNKHCTRFGLSSTDYGKTVILRGKTYKLVALKPKRSKYPLIAERDHTQYKLPLDLQTIQTIRKT